MSAPQVFALVSNSFALVFTTSVVLLMIFGRNWRTQTGQALFQFLGSLALLQIGALLTHLALAFDIADTLIEGVYRIALIGFFLVTLTGLALLLRSADAMKDAWQIICRAGVVGLVILQPAIWHYAFFEFDYPLDHTLFSQPFTGLGQVSAAVCAGFMVMVLAVGWRYWRQIDAPLMAGAIMSLITIQAFSLVVGPFRELSLTGATGGLVSVILGYHLTMQMELDPRASQTIWLQAMNRIAQAITVEETLDMALDGIADQGRRLIRTDVVLVLVTIGPTRLKVVAVSGTLGGFLGRQIRVGEGLAGRVMQTLYPMRVDNYHLWNGRSLDLDDFPIYASMSVPLIYSGRLVGALNAHETAPGRVFTDRDQTILELLAPHAASVIATTRLESELARTHTYFQTVMNHSAHAAMVFDPTGMLREANVIAWRYLETLFGETMLPLSVIQLAARAEDKAFTAALVAWTADPAVTRTIETAYAGLGRFHVDLLPIHHEGAMSDLLVEMRAFPAV